MAFGRHLLYFRRLVGGAYAPPLERFYYFEILIVYNKYGIQRITCLEGSDIMKIQYDFSGIVEVLAALYRITLVEINKINN